MPHTLHQETPTKANYQGLQAKGVEAAADDNDAI